jgi:hypothetical protein
MDHLMSESVKKYVLDHKQFLVYKVGPSFGLCVCCVHVFVFVVIVAVSGGGGGGGRTPDPHLLPSLPPFSLLCKKINNFS